MSEGRQRVVRVIRDMSVTRLSSEMYIRESSESRQKVVRESSESRQRTVKESSESSESLQRVVRESSETNLTAMTNE